MTKLAVGVVLAIALALVAVSAVSAQGPDVQIVELDCRSDPEIVKIENLEDEDQDLTGWELQSDPPDSQIFDLSVLSSLAGGTAITIQSGPSASGVFADPRWQTGEFVFRADDPTDYARIVDNAGEVVHQVNCSAAATPTPSPADIPNGGGPPPPTDGALSSAMLVLLGSTIAAVGVATLALPRLRLRPSLAANSHAQGVVGDQSGMRPLSPTLGLAMLALATVVFLLMQRRRG